MLNAESEIKGAEPHQRELRLTPMALLAVVFLLSFIGLLVLYRRVRRTNLAFEWSNRQLQVLSGQDALTALANRRHFQAAVLVPFLPDAVFGASSPCMRALFCGVSLLGVVCAPAGGQR